MEMDMSEVVLSICIPTYNRGNLVYECVEDILKTDYKNIEVIVSNNASTDNTKHLLNRITDKRFRYYENEENNVYLNIINVMEYAKGKWILLLSDECRFKDLKDIKKMMDYLSRLAYDEVSLVCTEVCFGDGELAHNLTDGRYKKGFDAFREICCLGFIDGIIYNRSMIKFPMVWNVIKELNSNDLIVLYPHLVVQYFLSRTGDVIYWNRCSLMETAAVGKYHTKWDMSWKEFLDLSLYLSYRILDPAIREQAVLDICVRHMYRVTWDYLRRQRGNKKLNNVVTLKNYAYHRLLLSVYLISIVKNRSIGIVEFFYVFMEYRREYKEYKKILMMSLMNHDKWFQCFYDKNCLKLTIH